MAGGGTGTPIMFQCSACRRRKPSFDRPGWAEAARCGWASRVRLTGRTRPNRSRNRWRRVSDTVREYECLDCGHVGWSNHVDLERKERGEDPRRPALDERGRS